MGPPYVPCRSTPAPTPPPSHGALPFGVASRRNRFGERQQAFPLVVIECQEKMRFFAVHQPQAQKRLFAALLPILPDGIDDLDLVEVAGRDDIVSEIGIADHDVVDDLAARQQDEVEPALLFIPFRQILVDVSQCHLALAERRANTSFNA